MGTSLSGLTPATTFDGLLKVGDNDPLTATLKPISTGDGTDTILQLSNSALQIGGTFNVDSGIATFKGVGSSSLTSSFIIKNSADTEIFRVRDDGQIFAQYINGQSVSASAYALYGADYAPNIRVNIKGSGATSATTSLLVQNSAGTDMLKVQDDSSLLMYRAANGAELLKITESGGNAILYANGNANRSLVLGYQNTLTAFNQTEFKTYNGTGYSEAMVITGNSNTSQFVGIGETTPTARLHVKGSGNDNTTTSLLVQNSDGTNLFKVNDAGNGFYINDDEASKLRFYASGNSGLILGGRNLRIESGGGNPININGSGTNGVIIGTTATNAAANISLAVRGKGATSATTALLVQNSAGTDVLKVDDAGTTTISGNTLIQRSNGQLLAYFNGTAAICDFNPSNNAGFDTKFRGGTDNFVLYIDAGNDNVGMGTNAPNASAKLAVDSTTQGFLPPRMTDAERDAIATPAAGLMIYDTTNNQMNYWNGSTWIAF